MLQTVYQYGSRIRIDPEREDDEVDGPVVRFEERNEHNPYTPTEQIVFDWKKGYLKMDAPQAVTFTGLMGNVGESVTFEHGVTLSDVSIDNPEGIYSPVGDEKYIAFSLYSQDGKPLDEAERASLSLVSTSFNTGFKLGEGERPNPYKPRAGATAGTTPVLTARVGGTVRSDAIDGMRYTLRDWNLNEIGSGTVEGGELRIDADQPVFVVELER